MAVNFVPLFKKLSLCYFGAPDFSARLLKKIIQDKNLPLRVKLVITQPDKPIGRKQILTPTPVKTMAQKYNIKVVDDKFNILKSQLSQIDIALVYSYGNIIPAELLIMPKYGFWNIHPSLLPRYRGPAPIAYSLFLGENQTGVTLIQMDEKIDHGPIIAQEKITITQSDKRSDLEIKLTDKGYKLFRKMIVKLISTKFTDWQTKKQNHHHATYTKRLTKNEGFVALEMIKKLLLGEMLTNNELPHLISHYLSLYPQEKINFFKRTLNPSTPFGTSFSLLTFNLFRGLSPWPGIWTLVFIKGQQKRLKIIDATLNNDKLQIITVQLEGKKPVDFASFNKTYDFFRSETENR